MTDPNPRASLSPLITAVMILATIGVIAIAYAQIRSARGDPQPSTAQVADDHSDHDHSDHDHSDHDHSSGHAEGTESIDLSAQARANLGLQLDQIAPGRFTQYIEVPGVVTNWPGRTHIVVTSPLTGVINAIYVGRGELIESGTPLFALRLTHQDLVNTQEQFLAQLGQLDVEEREIQRLSSIASSGAIAGKTLLTRQYERDKLLAGMRAARQAMLLHGLNEQQISQIENTRTLVREVTVFAPELHEDGSLHHDSLHDPSPPPSLPPVSAAGSPRLLPPVDADASVRLTATRQPMPEHPPHVHAEMLVTELNVALGQAVEAGAALAQLSDYSKVLIEGQAFQSDASALRRAAQSDTRVQAVLESSSQQRETIDDLKIVYIGNEVARQSRALPFYVELENEIERSEIRRQQQYVSWRYKPGQRLTLRLPVQQIENVFVVANEAIAEEGAERYVFVNHGDHFDRIPVNVVARDTFHSAIARDGQLIPGQTIAITAAHQLQMAIKNKTSGPVDAHHGHSH